MLKRAGRILAWSFGSIFLLALVWLAANRLTDERPDPRRDAFVSAGPDVPDDQNIAVGVAGLSAPSGANFMKFGADIKRMYEAFTAWPEIWNKAHGANELKLTVEPGQITCWIDPDSDVWAEWKECLPFKRAHQVLSENRELLGRYKRLYELERYKGWGYFTGSSVVSLGKLAVAEMRLDIKEGREEAAYAKWRDHFRFTRRFLHGQDGWVAKAAGMVDLSISLALIEDLLVRRPGLSKTHHHELIELLLPEGVDLIDPAGVARAEYLNLEYYLGSPYSTVAGYEDRLNWLGWHLGQRNRIKNRRLAVSIDISRVMRQPWARLPDEFAALYDAYAYPKWDVVVDPFGWLLLQRNVRWELKPSTLLNQVYLLDGRLRLTTLAVRIGRERIKDEDINAFLAKVEPSLSDPFSGKPMLWSPEHGQVYFLSGDKNCDVTAVRVPVWDLKSKRSPPKLEGWSAC